MGGIFFLLSVFSCGIFSCAYIKKIDKLHISVLCFMFFSILVLLTGLRYNFGYDFPQYFNMIQGTKSFDGIELSHVYLMRFAYQIGFPQVYFLIISILIFSYYLKLNNDPFSRPVRLLSLVFFMVFPLGYIESISILRQYVAIVCFVYLWHKEKLDIFSFIALGIGFLSHFSFIVGVLFLTLKFINIKPRVYIYVFSGVVGFIVINVILKYLILHYAYFNLFNTLERSGLLLTISSVIVPLICMRYIIKMEITSLYKDCNLIFLGVLIFICLSTFNVQMSRLAYYPLLIVPIVAAKISYRYSLFKWFCFVFLICTLCYRFYISSELPYDYLNNIEINFS